MDVDIREEIDSMIEKIDAAKVYVLDMAPMYHAFKTTLHAQIVSMVMTEEDEEQREHIEAAIITRMMAHVLEFQRNNDIHYVERSVKMAVNILKEYDLPDAEKVVSTWLPILLWGTALFIKKRLRDISRVWELKSVIDGALWISPVIEESDSKESPHEGHVT